MRRTAVRRVSLCNMQHVGLQCDALYIADQRINLTQLRGYIPEEKILVSGINEIFLARML